MSDGIIYTANKAGELLFFKDLARNGTASWAHGGIGQVIGHGFGAAEHDFVFSGGDGIIYIANKAGELLFLKDLARNGTASWAHGGIGQVIGHGFGAAEHDFVFSGGDGIIYIANKAGELLFLKDLARDGTPNWAHGGIGQVIGHGFGAADNDFVFSGGDGIIYVVKKSGVLTFVKDLARNGTASWAHGGISQVIGHGFGAADNDFVFSGGDGIIYIVKKSGELTFVKDLARNGTASWAHGGISQVIGHGFGSTDNDFVFSG
jgi:hypothetical protein